MILYPNKKLIGVFFVLVVGIIIGSITIPQLGAKEVKKMESKLTGNALLTNNRDQLNICVEISTSSFPKELENKDLSTLLEKWINTDLKEHPDWKSKGFDGYRLNITNGCPFTPFLLQDGAKHPIFSGEIVPSRYIEEPSPYRFAVFVVDQSIIEKHFKGINSRWGPEELLCEGEECNEVTSAIYLTVDEVKNNNGQKYFEEVKHMFGIDKPSNTITTEQQQAKSEKSN